MTTDEPIRQLHAAYVRLTGLEVSLNMSRIFAWDLWISLGWTEKDLALVVEHMKRTMDGAPMQKAILMRCLSFRTIVQNTERFSEWLAEAKAYARTPKYCPEKRDVLRATGREDRPKPPEARTPAQIMAGDKALAELVALKNSL